MEPERWRQIERLYYAALEREPDERAAFLAEACAGDESLRREVASFIAAGDRIGSFMEAPAEAVAAATPAPAPQPSMIGQTLTHYRIVSLLGRGGMGEVYLGEDTTLGRQVALKLLPAAFTSDRARLRRFEQEARAASALNHPNIITIHEISQTDGLHYLVTEYIESETLRQRMAAGRMKLSEAVEVAVQVAGALAAAHAAGITHRDIKPENVMVRPDGLVKVLDFGLAKLAERTAPTPESMPESLIDSQAPTVGRLSTEPGLVMGTVSYMSPEQARGLKVDHRTDIFSLGVMIYEMVAGRRPFVGATASDVIAEILRSEPPPVSQLRPGLPPELERMISRMLAKDREARYQNAAELRAELQRLQRKLESAADEAVSAAETPAAIAQDKAAEETEREEPAEAATNEVVAARTTSSAGIIIGEIKRHKLAALIALLVLVAAATGIGLYLHARNTEVAIDSIAVLPFANQNGAEETEYLADGLTESIINNLTQLPDLRVIARNSAFRYKGKETDLLGAGRTLGVRAVVVGRVLQRGENLIVSAELVDVRENKQLWGQQYNRKLADVFAVQGEIAKEISEKLRLKLTGQEKQQLAKRPTENLKAFQYYMQGRVYSQRRTREGLLSALRYYEKAIGEDRNYALAYTGIAEAYSGLGGRGYITPLEGRRKAEEAARKALALDENLAEAHAALGLVYTAFAPFNFALGDRELRRAIELSPSLAMAHQQLGNSHARQGRLDENLEEGLKARELDPLSPIIARAVALPYYLKRDYARALELLRQANELGPSFINTWEIGVYIQNRLFDETLAELEKAKRERKDDPILIYDTGMVYAAQGNRAEALRIIKELEAMSGASLSQAHWIAKIYVTLGEKESALTWLERSLSTGAIGAFLKDEPVWDALHGDARFDDLLRRMGVPQ